jgi:hypothetical protein
MSPRLLAHVGVAVATLLCALFAFWAALDNGFWGSDFHFLERAAAAETDAAVLVQSWVEPFQRPLSQLAFYSEYTLWDLDSHAFLLTHVLLHAFNSTLLFALLRGPVGPQGAAGAAILFALGFGFFGETVLRIADLAHLLGTTFVLATGIVALRAQLERTPRLRLTATLFAASFFLAALLSHEGAIMALVMFGGLMWPHRRSISSVTRKMALLVAIAVAWLGVQVVRGIGVADLLTQADTWLEGPWRVLRLAALSVVPIASDSVPEPGGSLLQRFLQLVDQMRPILGLFLVASATVWFWRGAGAVRWLLASWLGYLVALGVLQPPGTTAQLADAYLPAAFFCGAVAHGFRLLWIRATPGRRVLLGLVFVVALHAGVVRVQTYELLADERGRSLESRRLLQELQSRPRGDAPGETQPEREGVSQKSAPIETFDPEGSAPQRVS